MISVAAMALGKKLNFGWILNFSKFAPGQRKLALPSGGIRKELRSLQGLLPRSRPHIMIHVAIKKFSIRKRGIFIPLGPIASERAEISFPPNLVFLEKFDGSAEKPSRFSHQRLGEVVFRWFYWSRVLREEVSNSSRIHFDHLALVFFDLFDLGLPCLALSFWKPSMESSSFGF